MYEIILVIAAYLLCTYSVVWVNKLVIATMTRNGFGGGYLYIMSASFAYIIWYFATK